MNKQTKFDFALKFFHTKPPGKEIQEKIWLNKIVSIKPTFVANWVIWKTQPNLEIPSSFIRTFTTSTAHQVIFKIKSHIIGLTTTRTNVKQKLVVLHAENNIGHKSNQGVY